MGYVKWASVAACFISGCSGNHELLGANAGWIVEYVGGSSPACQLVLKSHGRRFVVRYTSDDLVMILSKESWQPTTTTIALRLFIETTVEMNGEPREGYPLVAKMEGKEITGQLRGLGVGYVGGFFGGLSTHLIIDFPGTEENWEIIYGPARPLTNIFNDCVARVDAEAPAKKDGQPM